MCVCVCKILPSQNFALRILSEPWKLTNSSLFSHSSSVRSNSVFLKLPKKSVPLPRLVKQCLKSPRPFVSLHTDSLGRLRITEKEKKSLEQRSRLCHSLLGTGQPLWSLDYLAVKQELELCLTNDSNNSWSVPEKSIAYCIWHWKSYNWNDTGFPNYFIISLNMNSICKKISNKTFSHAEKLCMAHYDIISHGFPTSLF